MGGSRTQRVLCAARRPLPRLLGRERNRQSRGQPRLRFHRHRWRWQPRYRSEKPHGPAGSRIPECLRNGPQDHRSRAARNQVEPRRHRSPRRGGRPGEMAGRRFRLSFPAHQAAALRPGGSRARGENPHSLAFRDGAGPAAARGRLPLRGHRRKPGYPLQAPRAAHGVAGGRAVPHGQPRPAARFLAVGARAPAGAPPRPDAACAARRRTVAAPAGGRRVARPA